MSTNIRGHEALHHHHKNNPKNKTKKQGDSFVHAHALFGALFGFCYCISKFVVAKYAFEAANANLGLSVAKKHYAPKYILSSNSEVELTTTSNTCPTSLLHCLRRLSRADVVSNSTGTGGPVPHGV